ncbi:hypothetical protein AGMMS50230_21200 [Spirochaetia bacterium]|nr:hypothetical protein AGMMS50230_21200 [Spirochaetia bacterium]
MLYAESVPQSVNVTAGGSNVALIELGPAWSAGNDVDFGGDPDKYAYFSDSDGPNDLYNYLSGLTTGNHVVVVEGDQHQTTTTELVLAGGKISLRGSGTFKRVGTGARSLFNISSGGELIVRGPTLQGDGTTINKALVTVDGGILTLYEGRITGAAGWGNATGGVVVENGGIFTMEGGTISNNTNQSLGGGVAVTDVGSKFFMKGGTINGNKATDSGSGGAGVYVNFNGEFTMEGGTISGNTATLGRGGGVLVTGSGTFTMSGGTINGNNQATDGGGVYVPSSGTFTKYNISGNSGSIENNTASGEGQQVYKAAGTLHQRNTGVGPGLNMSTATTDDTNPPWEL